MTASKKQQTKRKVESLRVTDEIITSLTSIIELYVEYVTHNIQLLNKFIGHMRRVSTLRFERTTLIKFVKKLRFYNESLQNINIKEYTSAHDDLSFIVVFFGSFSIKFLETLDLLKYFFTESLQKEILSKTLNSDLTLSSETILNMDITYNHFVKFTQWMIESINLQNNLLSLEIIEFTLKCAAEDGTSPEETDNIFLQQVATVEDEEEYQYLMDQWSQVLREKVQVLEDSFEVDAAVWQENLGKIKN
ncbi:She2p NDAI_0E02030 [Naumovozyma dairenensis CBS 421]|uniref:RNA binding protein She2 domain-containing protein n=1 Tax=Naumovozyma dairenensis (strain ATCC 10597 / BCRC 20456 / CBS 421 / NBRC 0211 / NRRL Y-12639) TaxID=1071378 RepID=G0WB99_NAUDC|nr:hypothetical protein NDAI_0E02030 [Naumovozyma dairenensis CBS 421]CCD25019.1 hypothetical protein NDAI_0E02030 [Naumovozyma dairenensis CBS 421]